MTDDEMNEIESNVDRMIDKIEAATVSKAVLILDKMPDRCGHCRLAVMQRCYPICAVTGLECAEGGKPEWCPLEPMGVPTGFGTGKAYMMTKLEGEYE